MRPIHYQPLRVSNQP